MHVWHDGGDAAAGDAAVGVGPGREAGRCTFTPAPRRVDAGDGGHRRLADGHAGGEAGEVRVCWSRTCWWYYCAYEPLGSAGDEAYKAIEEAEREADSEYGRQAGRCTSAAFTAALDTLVEKLGVLEEHACLLLRRAHGCGRRDALRGAADLVHEPG